MKTCPRCKANLVERHNKNTGAPFWGCSKFPKCKYTKSIRQLVGDEDLYPDRPDEDDDGLYGDAGNWMDFGDN